MGYFRELGHTVIGTELNDKLVTKANMAGYTAYNGAVWEINELQSSNFDIIVAMDVVEHMTYEELLNLFLWTSAHLNKSGQLCLRFPEGASPFGLSHQNGDFTHISSLTQSKIASICLTSNLKIVSYHDDILSSNKLCSIGALGKFILFILQSYVCGLKWIIISIFYLLSSSFRLGTNSITFIALNKSKDTKKEAR